MSTLISKFIFACIVLQISLITGCKSDLEKATDFDIVKFNNPGLTVDLGVGLWAWPLPVDYDKDGDMDLLVDCSGVPYNGLWFFENPGNSVFPVFCAPERISESRKNIQISYINNIPMVLIPGIEYLNFTDSLYQQPDTIFKDTVIFDPNFIRIRANQWKYVDYEGDGDLDIIAGIEDLTDYGWDNAFNKEGIWTNGPLHGYIYLFENDGSGKYSKPKRLKARGKDIDMYGRPSPNFADFDNDGDLDIICGEFIDKLTWFENIGTRSIPEYAPGKFLKNGNQVMKMDLAMIIPVAVDWDLDGDVDLITGDEDGRVAFIENTGSVNQDGPIFNKPKYFKQQAQDLKFGVLVTPYSVDWDDDGDEDLICGNSAGYIGFIENLDGGNPPVWAEPKYLTANGVTIRIQAGYNGSIQGPCEEKWGYTTLSVADWDGDGLKDIIINSIWGKVEWFKNIGSKGNPQLTQAKPIEVEWSGVPPKPSWVWWNPKVKELVTQWRSTPVAIDWNKDGLMDLIMLDHEGYLAFFERYLDNNSLKLKPGRRIFKTKENSWHTKNHSISNEEGGLLRLNSEEAGASGRRKICFTDWNNDGKLDLIVNSSTNVNYLCNMGEENGYVILKDMGQMGEKILAYHDTSPTTVDWDKNGIRDLLVGAEDGHFYFKKNSIKK